MTHLRTPRLLALLPLAAALSLALPAHASDAHATPTAPAKLAKPTSMAPSPGKPPAEADPMDKLRDRLSEKLGAQKPPEGGANVLRVSTASKPADDGHAAPAPKKAAPKKAEAHGAAHWDYKGEVGPAAWGGLKPEFSLCGNGKRQSPIDIRDGIAVDLEPVQFDYRASGFRVIDNGHTIQVNVASGNFINVGGRRWELLQFHFHRPSEERIDGRQFDMVAHLVHKDSDGKLAVVAVLLDRGSIQPLVQTVWNNLPLEKGEEYAPRAVIDLNHLLPPDRRYFTYMGSLTTPPCSEGVLWMVMRSPVQVSQEQVDIFARLYPMNARPVQQASGRLIKQSQ
ncbi:MAG: carbonic anhydrase family protein [Rubrivivax sp.]